MATDGIQWAQPVIFDLGAAVIKGARYENMGL
jgi:hypothetical protein